MPIKPTSNADPQNPIAAVDLIRMLDRESPLPDALCIRKSLHDEQLRLEMAADLGVRGLIDSLKTRYKIT